MPGMYSGSDAFSHPVTRPVLGMRDYAAYYYPMANNQNRFFNGRGGATNLYKQFRDNYNGNNEAAGENAKIYSDYAKGLFANQPNQFENYKNTGDYLYGLFDKYRDASATAGIKSMNERLAQQGIRPGSSSYDRLLNATRITSGLNPAYQTTIGAIAPGYQAQSNNNFRDTMLRLNLADNDALTGYIDRVAARPLDIYQTKVGMLNDASNSYSNLINNYNKNIQGWQTTEGSDIARYGKVFDNWMNSVYSGYGGGGQPQQSSNGVNMNTQNGNNYNPSLDSINAPYYGGNSYLGDVNTSGATAYSA